MHSVPCHILLLEDDPGISALVRAALNGSGFPNVRASASIAGARQCWHAQLGKFDLFITDFQLPDGSAPAFINELLRYSPNLRIILMSGFSEDALGLESDLSRRVALLQKPFLVSDLLDAIAKATKAASAITTNGIGHA